MLKGNAKIQPKKMKITKNHKQVSKRQRYYFHVEFL